MTILYSRIKEYYYVTKFVHAICHNEARLTETLRHFIEIKRINKDFSTYLNTQSREFDGKAFNSGAIAPSQGMALYWIVRVLKPRIILETGCGWGASSTYFLRALNENRAGMLFSIDLPRFEEMVDPMDYPIEDRGGIIPKGKQSGWLVPVSLRNRWELILGKSSETLQPLLNKLGQIDIFFHDSLHSYENMLYEYQTVWPFIRKKGILLSHNINLNKSFFDFCNILNTTYVILKPIMCGDLLGAIVKN